MTRIHLWIGGFALALAIGHGNRVSAAPVALPAPATAAWEPLTFPKVPRHTQFAPLPDGGVRGLAECAGSGRVLPLDAVDLATTPRLRWRWRIEVLPAAEDERRKAGDDFAARVAVMFTRPPASASWWRRLRLGVLRRFSGHPVPGSALTYVRTRDIPAGTHWPSPYGGHSMLISLGTGPTDGWREAVVDVAADYTRLFDAPPPPLLALGIMVDADNTCSRAVAAFGDFRFVGAGQ